MLNRKIRNLTLTGITIISAAMLTVLGATGASAAPTATANPGHAQVAAAKVISATPDSCVFRTLGTAQFSRYNPAAHGSFTSIIWLRYNPCNRTVWAHEVGQAPNDHIWVYNEDTGQIWSANYPNATTGPISDANTRSRACMNNSTNNYLGMPTTCTGYF